MSLRSTLITGAATALLSGLLTWQVQGWRYQAQLSTQAETHALVLQDISNAALKRQQALQAELDRKQTNWVKTEQLLYGELRNAETENDRLRGLVDSGSVRLRVNATCKPVNSDRLSGTEPTTGLGDGATAELNRDARQDYFALRSGIERVTQQLKACQDRLR